MQTILGVLLAALVAVGCTGNILEGGNNDDDDDDTVGDDDDDDDDDFEPQVDGGSDPLPESNFSIELVPQSGSSDTQRINFAIPLPPGMLGDADAIRISRDGGELATARRALASWPDGSLRSVQIQLDLAVPAATSIDVAIGEAAAGGDLTMAAVSETLVAADGTGGPRVWALLPADWLSASRVAGPMAPAPMIAGTPLVAWDSLCDYAAFDTDTFLAIDGETGSWLFDRTTAMYRGYQHTGELVPLESAYREAAIYRAGLTGTDAATRIGVPGAADDLKYHYTQGMAIHYLLTGDDRFREAAEDVATRAAALWTSPGYAGGADFWTERHAGFGLLAYEWAAMVSDDQAATFAALAAEAVDAYLDVQDASPGDADARCFAHSAEAHGEDYGSLGCSPWMSAILADGLENHTSRVGGEGAAPVGAALVKLGRMIANEGRDGDGRPYYWMGVGSEADAPDEYDEHWGESAYIVGMAWHFSGRNDPALRAIADELVAGLGSNGEAGQLRSFNWQCRSAVTATYFLAP
jgi:hypothetical protein